ncbi:MAG: cyclase family protein [Chloroflexi bacterium]|nr:cyclase family protein [Chloroflexota bacterium]
MTQVERLSALDELARALSGEYRLVDLSEALVPGQWLADGHYRWSQTPRRYELRQWISPGGHFQHFVDAASQVGTHVETPAHIADGARLPDGSPISPGDVPLETFFGPAAVINCDAARRAGDGSRPLVSVEQVRAARPHDIVLLWSSTPGPNGPALSDEAARWLADLPIKLIGEQHVVLPNEPHRLFLGRTDHPIPIMEELKHLETLSRDRVLFFGLPLRVHRIEATSIRAIAFEPIA